ncbi:MULTISPECIES: thioesterase II family protein [unclassified Streptomyces]|uniref:thioesterase II family protein n=1 Tax=unclassified Streptomyces TaxID=2593676 RepID=UPI0036F894F0
MSAHTDEEPGRGVWLRRYVPAAAPLPATLVCLPHAGGAPTFFRPWAERLAGSLDVVPVCYPGRQDRFTEPCVTRMHVLAEEVADALLPLTDRPLALFGHSLGAALGYEVARLLRQAHGKDVAHLFVSGMVPPHLVPPGRRHLEGDEALIADVLEQGGTDAALLADEDFRAFLLPAIRGDYRLMETYTFTGADRALNAPVTVYYGRQDKDVSAEAAGEWARHTTGPTEVLDFPGGHFYLQDVLETLVADVERRVLDSVRGPGHGPRPAALSPR